MHNLVASFENNEISQESWVLKYLGSILGIAFLGALPFNSLNQMGFLWAGYLILSLFLKTVQKVLLRKSVRSIYFYERHLVYYRGYGRDGEIEYSEILKISSTLGSAARKLIGSWLSIETLDQKVLFQVPLYEVENILNHLKTMALSFKIEINIPSDFAEVFEEESLNQ